MCKLTQFTDQEIYPKQVSFSGRSTTLEQKRSFQSQVWPQIFFLEVLAPLDVRHCPKLQSCAISRKCNDATLKDAKNPDFGSSLGFSKFFPSVFPLLALRQCSKLSSYAVSRKTNRPNFKKMPKKANFEPDFVPLVPNLGHQFFFAGFTSTSSQILFQPIIQCNLKEN